MIDDERLFGEILALLGPNGAGKTTLISIICGLVVPTGGTVRVGGHDIRTDWRAARKLIGLVPQEIALEPFEKVLDTVRFTRAVKERIPLDQRRSVIAAMWSVALTDGPRGAAEESAIRLAASLLGVNDVDSALARQSVEGGGLS